MDKGYGGARTFHFLFISLSLIDLFVITPSLPPLAISQCVVSEASQMYSRVKRSSVS